MRRAAFIYLTMLCLVCQNALAQGLVEEWSIPLAPSRYALSHDGSQFAYRLSKNQVVRLNGLSGNIIDTIDTPLTDHGGSIAYCGNRLYILGSISNNEQLLYHLNDLGKSIVSTGFGFRRPTSGYVNMGQGYLLSIPGQPYIYVRADASSRSGGSTSSGNVWATVDTATHKANCVFGDQLRQLSWSSDLRFFTLYTSGSTYSVESTPNRTSYHDALSEYRNGKRESILSYQYTTYDNGDPEDGNRAPDGILGAIHVGSPDLVAYKSVLFNMKSRVSKVLKDFSGNILASLYAPTIVLKKDKHQSQLVLSTYNLASGVSIPADTLESCDYVWVNGVSEVVFAQDSKAGIFRRYRIKPIHSLDTVAVEASKDNLKVFETVKLTAVPFLRYNTIDRYDWVVGYDNYIDDNSEITVSSNQPVSMKVKVFCIDSENRYTRTANGPTLQFYRPVGSVMANRCSDKPIRSMSLSQNGELLVASSDERQEVVQLQSTSVDNSFKSRDSTPGFAFGAYGNLDSMRSGIRTEDYYDVTFTFKKGFRNLINEQLIESLVIGKFVQTYPRLDTYPMAFRCEMMYNEPTNSWYALLRARINDSWSSAIVREGVWCVGRKDSSDNGWIVPFSQQDIRDVDVHYGRTMLLTTTFQLICIDLTTRDTMFVDSVKNIDFPVSAFQLDDSTIVTSRGIITRAQSWKQSHSFDFRDGHKCVRINNSYSLVLRKNADSVGCIIDNWSGATVAYLGEGFGSPTTAVYDSSRMLIHIGDEWGVIATYDISRTVSTKDQSDTHRSELVVTSATPNSIQIITPPSVESVELYTLFGTLLCTQPIVLGTEKTTIDLNWQLASGVYVAVALGTTATHSSIFAITR